MKISRSVLVGSDDETTLERLVHESQFLHDEEEVISIVSANSFGATWKLFLSNPSICAIVIDVCMQGPNAQSVLELVKKIKETFTGPMIATSSASFFRDPAVEAICGHYASKDNLIKELHGILQLHLG
jgi:hypothetical protein